MAEAQAGHSNAQQDQQEEQQRQGEEQRAEGEGDEQRQAERTYTQAELDRILGKVRKNARYLGRKEAEAELVRQGATRQEAEKTVERQQQEQPKAPKREDFENYEDYLDARADFRARTTSREEQERAKTEQREQRVAEERTATQREFKKRAEALMKEDPDWAEKIESAENVMMSQAMGEAVQESEQGPRILGYFVDHPDEAERISKLPEKAQLREIGKLEARIEAELKAKAKPKGDEGEEEEKEDEAREDESAEADDKGKGKDEDRDADGRFKSQDKGSRKAPDPIEPGSGRSANQDRGPTDKDSDAGWMAKRIAQEKAERARQRGK